MVVDALARESGCRFKRHHEHYWSLHIAIGKEKAILAKPTTFMNRSGLAVFDLAGRYNLSPEQILIICDDLDLNIGSIRIRRQGSHGGHKGLKSLIDALQTESFIRMRLGIGRPVDLPVVDYVLSPFRRTDRARVKDTIETAANAVLHCVKNGADSAMNHFNKRQ